MKPLPLPLSPFSFLKFSLGKGKRIILGQVEKQTQKLFSNMGAKTQDRSKDTRQ